jgi:sugar O-acyltransferase (sialic acid O-acetyltransferase NeuD family)
MAPRKIVVFGNGSIAELAHYYFTEDSPHDVTAFTVDGEFMDGDTFMGLPMVAFEDVADKYPPDEFSIFIALSYTKLNRVRQEKFDAAKAKGYFLPSYIASHLATWDNVDIGDNCFILENQTIQPFCKIGDNVTLWSGNHIGHHSSIADHTFIASHVVVSGYSTVGQRCFIGVNATLRDSCTVGDDSFIGMAAAVTTDVPEGSVVLGQSSDVLAPDDRRARAVKRSYFKI